MNQLAAKHRPSYVPILVIRPVVYDRFQKRIGAKSTLVALA